MFYRLFEIKYTFKALRTLRYFCPFSPFICIKKLSSTFITFVIRFSKRCSLSNSNTLTGFSWWSWFLFLIELYFLLHKLRLQLQYHNITCTFSDVNAKILEFWVKMIASVNRIIAMKFSEIFLNNVHRQAKTIRTTSINNPSTKNILPEQLETI